MTLNDPLANVLSNITNAEVLGKKEVSIPNNNNTIKMVLKIMKENSFIGDVTHPNMKSTSIALLGRINKTNVIKPRFSVQMAEYDKYEKRYLPAKDFGFLIVSTNLGLMTHIQAKEKQIGGKLIAYCY